MYEHPLTSRMQEPSDVGPVDVYRQQAAGEAGRSPSDLALAVEGRALPYGLLCSTHPEYEGEYWAEIRALYHGGKRLLRDPGLFERLFPKHAGEKPKTYAERKRRAYYVNHLGTIVDVIVAGLSADPLRLSRAGDADAELRGFWREFSEDCSPPGGVKQSFSEMILEQARTGLLLGRFCTLVDLPRDPHGTTYPSLAAQKGAGALDFYAVPIPPECVTEWEFDDSGDLKWALYKRCLFPRESIFVARDTVREEYRYYTRDSWTLYVVEYSVDQSKKDKRERPKPDDLIQPVDAGSHTFERVPIVVETVPTGLWAGNKLHSMAVEYLNKSCGLSWAEYKTVYSQLYEFLAPAMGGIDSVPNEHQEDSQRSQRTPRGPGNVQVRGNEDSAEYVAPPADGFTHVAEQQKRLAEDMFRVTYQMALAEDNTGAMVRRSAESKGLDHEVTKVVLGAVSTKCLRPHAERVAGAGAKVRGESEDLKASGLENFAEVDPAALTERAGVIELIPIPSATYQRIRKLRLAKADLAEDATPEVVEKIRRELESSITQDQFDVQREADLRDEEARLTDADARDEEAGARASEAGRVRRGELPVSQRKPPKPKGSAKPKAK